MKLGKRYSSDCTGDGPSEEQKNEQQDHRVELFAAHRQNVINIEARFTQETEYITMVLEADVERFRRDIYAKGKARAGRQPRGTGNASWTRASGSGSIPGGSAASTGASTPP